MGRAKNVLVRQFRYSLGTLRKRLNLTQQSVADQSGMSRVEVSNIERGKCTPSLETVERLAKALGVDPLDMLR